MPGCLLLTRPPPMPRPPAPSRSHDAECGRCECEAHQALPGPPFPWHRSAGARSLCRRSAACARPGAALGREAGPARPRPAPGPAPPLYSAWSAHHHSLAPVRAQSRWHSRAWRPSRAAPRCWPTTMPSSPRETLSRSAGSVGGLRGMARAGGGMGGVQPSGLLAESAPCGPAAGPLLPLHGAAVAALLPVATPNSSSPLPRHCPPAPLTRRPGRRRLDQAGAGGQDGAVWGGLERRLSPLRRAPVCVRPVPGEPPQAGTRPISLSVSPARDQALHARACELQGECSYS